MTFLEKIKIRVLLAILLKDDFSPDKTVIGDVFLKVAGIRKKPVMHSTGYCLLVDAPEGKYTVTTGGKFYKEESIIIDTSSLTPTLPFGAKPSSPKLPLVEINLIRK